MWGKASRGEGLCLAGQGGVWDPFPGGRLLPFPRKESESQ